MNERAKTIKRLHTLAYLYTEEYVRELDNKKREDAMIREAEKNGEAACIVLTAENNAKVMMSCITDVMHAVNILNDAEEDVPDWMLAGINAMLDKVNETHDGIPFDLSVSICGLLCSQFR